jgi:hypothetical protein
MGVVETGGCIEKFPDWVDNEITTINTRWGKTHRLIHKIAIQLQPVAESCTICSSRSRRPVRKLLDIPPYSATRVFFPPPGNLRLRKSCHGFSGFSFCNGCFQHKHQSNIKTNFKLKTANPTSVQPSKSVNSKSSKCFLIIGYILFQLYIIIHNKLWTWEYCLKFDYHLRDWSFIFCSMILFKKKLPRCEILPQFQWDQCKFMSLFYINSDLSNNLMSCPHSFFWSFLIKIWHMQCRNMPRLQQYVWNYNFMTPCHKNNILQYRMLHLSQDSWSNSLSLAAECLSNWTIFFNKYWKHTFHWSQISCSKTKF